MSVPLRAGEDVTTYLQRHEHKELLRLVTVGSVDDGKSTLIGRLLHDAHGIYEDQLSAVKRASKMGGEIDFSLFTDGLRAEREQGITIDVAYRYFSTEKRKFIIADTPGHVQYTRNMATGASTADVAVILIDARLGVLPQSRRHAFIASLLGIPDLLACVNKMDLVGYDAETYRAIVAEFSAFAQKLGFRGVHFIPISALRGENVVDRAGAMPFYDGPPVLELLESIPLGDRESRGEFRFPVQTVLRPDLDYRAYAGQVVAGSVRAGDEVMVLPSRKRTTVAGIDTYEGPIASAAAPQSVAIRLADDLDVSRGEMIVRASQGREPRAVQRFDAMMVWMHERRLDRGKSYLLKHTTRTVRAEIEQVVSIVDLETLTDKAAADLGLNDIGRVTVRTHRPLFVDPYRENRATGAFVVIDSLTNDTVAAGMILPEETAGDRSRAGDPGSLSVHTQVSSAERRERLGHGGGVVWVRGTDEASLSLAYALERVLFDRGCVAAVFAGGPSAAKVAAFGAQAGVIVVVAAGSEEPRPLCDVLGSDRIVEVDAPDSLAGGAGGESERVAEQRWEQIEARGWIGKR